MLVDNPPVCNLTMYFSCAVPTISESFAFNFSFSKLNKSLTVYYSCLNNLIRVSFLGRRGQQAEGRQNMLQLTSEIRIKRIFNFVRDSIPITLCDFVHHSQMSLRSDTSS